MPDDKGPISAAGEVMWCLEVKEAPAPFAIGIKLTDIKPEDKFRVLDYAYQHWLKNEFGDVSSFDTGQNS
jgi:hypothetical protein